MAYSQEFRAQAVKLALEIGPSHAAQRLGISRTSINVWFPLIYPGGLTPAAVDTLLSAPNDDQAER